MQGQTSRISQISTFHVSSFHLYDVSAFPLVTSRSEAMPPGYASRWCDEMTSLVGQDRPFVLIHGPHAAEETHEDRKRRAIWLKQHKTLLGQLCRTLIHIEPDPDRRAAMQAQAAMAVKAFGVPVAMAATMAEALVLGNAALSAVRAHDDAGAQDDAAR
ncbi:hypothetical protein P3W85_26840 [Cupriavidus basilensis]|uniref:Uncharacterized protein n=1 Tax=Cupriavidus basilensis TaxID=68895 RepID=A0ABT6AV94_9BURK|nr:hypothetical protein [Cupriavidus basilensis]MDF3836543.1 hypothetical protein [Cupriavidus basilensis]